MLFDALSREFSLWSDGSPKELMALDDFVAQQNLIEKNSKWTHLVSPNNPKITFKKSGSQAPIFQFHVSQSVTVIAGQLC